MTPQQIAEKLAEPGALRRRCICVATLEAICGLDETLRYYRFDQHPPVGESMASMWDGSGNDFFIVFTESGAVLRVFDHESGLSPWGQEQLGLAPGLLDGCPESLAAIITGSTFQREGSPSAEITFCAWYGPGDDRWHVGSVEDQDDGGATYFLRALLDDTAATYTKHTREYYELEADPAAVAAVWDGAPINASLVERINPEADLAAVIETATQIGYPG